MSKKPAPTWETIKVRLGDLIPNPENPKYSDEETIGRLNDSIDTLGDFQPFVVNRDGVSAIDGHQRLNAWIAHLGEDFIVEAKKPSRKLTKTEIHKLILYSGKGTHGRFDMDALHLHFDDIELVEFGGFDPDDNDVDFDDMFFEEDDKGDEKEQTTTIELKYGEGDYEVVKDWLRQDDRSAEQIFYEALQR